MWQHFLRSRIVTVLGALAVVIVVWNIVVVLHDDGYLSGTVIADDGTPAAGARVVISELSLISRNIIDTAVTDAEGRFAFEKHDHHAMVLQAEKEGVGRSRRHNIRLYFRNQNKALKEPIVLDPSIVEGPKISEQSGAN